MSAIRLKLSWLPALFYALVVLGPGIALLADLTSVPLAEWWGLMLPQTRRLTLWRNSATLAVAVAAGSMSLGGLVALKLRHWRVGVRSELRWLFLLLAPLPALTHAMAWSWLFGRLNAALRHLSMSEIPFRGWTAAWWVQVLWLAPIATGLALVAFESVNPVLIEAGRIYYPGDRVLARVTFPLAAPLLFAGGALIFLLSLVDYAIPSLFQVNVYALDIFADFSVNNQPGRALLVSVPLLATTIAAVLFSQARLRPAALNLNWQQDTLTSATTSGWLRSLQQGALIVMLAGAAVPLNSLLLQLGSWTQLAESLLTARNEIGYSLRVALLTALISLPLATVAARGALAEQRGRWVWWLAITLPLAVPGPLVGIGLIWLWSQPLAQPLRVYGSTLMPVLASLARYTPLGALVLIAALRRLNPTLIEAAEIVHPGRIRTWLLVHLPLRAPGLLSAYGLVFCLTLSELSATLLVAAPGKATLSMRIYNFLHYGASDTVAGLTLVLTGLVLALGTVAALSLAGWSRLSAGGSDTRGEQP